ncbi:MAG: RluA family pseudouridine synthase [Acidimicrobiales bacterium]
MAYTELIPSALSGERIDRVVAMITGASRTRVTDWLDEGLVMCNDKVVTTRSRRVTEGDTVVIDVEPDLGPAPLVAEPDINVPIVYDDDDVIVIDKPAGLVVHPGAGNATGTLVQAMIALYPEIAAVGEPDRPGVVHRLDKDTSGLMLMARSAKAHTELSAMLAAHEVERTYLTLVWGIPVSGSGLIDAPIGRSTREPTKMIVSAQGRDARTRYTVLETFDGPVPCALVECRLETGRTHQIRVHMAAIGHTVVGDERYRGARPALTTPRIFLHSAALEFDHPVRSDERLSFVSELPEDLAAVLDQIRDQMPTAE